MALQRHLSCGHSADKTASSSYRSSTTWGLALLERGGGALGSSVRAASLRSAIASRSNHLIFLPCLSSSLLATLVFFKMKR